MNEKDASETEALDNWFDKRAKAEAMKDHMPLSERIGNIVGIIVGILVVLYFSAHQMWSTGFFTSSFGTFEMLLFYAVLIVGIISSALKALFARKNMIRPFDIIEAILAIVALSLFIIVFPFEFTYFADVLPDFLRFLLQWISDDIARVLMVLGIVVALIMSIYTAIIYLLVRRQLSKPSPKNV